MKPSEIKLEEFNNCPGQDILRPMSELQLRANRDYEVVDLSSETYPYWQNDGATLVLAIAKSGVDTRVALALGKIAVEWSMDEFDWRLIDGRYVIRLWWD